MRRGRPVQGGEAGDNEWIYSSSSKQKQQQHPFGSWLRFSASLSLFAAASLSCAVGRCSFVRPNSLYMNVRSQHQQQ